MVAHKRAHGKSHVIHQTPPCPHHHLLRSSSTPHHDHDHDRPPSARTARVAHGAEADDREVAERVGARAVEVRKVPEDVARARHDVAPGAPRHLELCARLGTRHVGLVVMVELLLLVVVGVGGGGWWRRWWLWWWWRRRWRWWWRRQRRRRRRWWWWWCSGGAVLHVKGGCCQKLFHGSVCPHITQATAKYSINRGVTLTRSTLIVSQLTPGQHRKQHQQKCIPHAINQSINHPNCCENHHAPSRCSLRAHRR